MKNTHIIFTTAPTGLGHIRVTKALISGLKNQKYSILGVEDKATSNWYRIISTNVYLRKTLEFTQTNPTAEIVVDNIMKKLQQINIKDTIKEIQKIIQKNPSTKEIIIVSTHALVAQKIQHILDNALLQIATKHVLIVTDDSPQRFWAVPVDLILAPSFQTKKVLDQIIKEKKLNTPVEVTPYPINLDFCRKLEKSVLYNKTEQLEPTNPQKARICIPVSGAAVHLSYYSTIIKELTDNIQSSNKREFDFSVVTREGNYTQPFINEFRNNPQVTFHIGASDIQTVELYDELYHQLNPPSLEITKPSEQAFKVLTTPDTVGGPILLLTEPVGRQEYDNLEFLERHKFLPSKHTHQELFKALDEKNKENISLFKDQAKTWRALRLPDDPIYAAKCITNCLSQGIFFAMQNYQGYPQTEELSPNGVEKIWEKVIPQTFHLHK